MERRAADFLRLAEILSPDPGQSAFVLQICIPPQDNPLELGCGHYPEFLLKRPLWTELEL